MDSKLNIICSKRNDKNDSFKMEITFDLRITIVIRELNIDINNNFEKPWVIIGIDKSRAMVTREEAEFIAREYFRLSKIF